MKKLFTSIIAILTVLALNTFGLALHVLAMPMPSHNMSHESDSASCAMLCRTAVFTKDDYIVIAEHDEKDDELLAILYNTNGVQRLDNQIIKSGQYANALVPLPKIPIYLLYSVLRV